MYGIATSMSLSNDSRMQMHGITISMSLSNDLRRFFLVFLLILAPSTSHLALRLRTSCISFLGYCRTTYSGYSTHS